MPESEFLSPQKVSDLLKVSCSTIKRWVDEGRMRAMVTPGGHRKIMAIDVLKIAREIGCHHININMQEGLSLSSDGHHGREDTACVRLYQGIRDADQEKVRAILLGAYTAGMPMGEIGDRIIMPAMQGLGEDWSRGTLDICQEHHATQGVLAALIEIRQRLMVSSRPIEGAPLAMGCAPEGDPYFIATLLVELVFLENRWQVINFGPNTPLSSLAKSVSLKKPRMVWVSATHVNEPAQFENDLSHLKSSLAHWGGELLLGGQAVDPGLFTRLNLGWKGKSLADLTLRIREIIPVFQAPKTGRPPLRDKTAVS